jgi:hypothetical protein
MITQKQFFKAGIVVLGCCLYCGIGDIFAQKNVRDESGKPEALNLVKPDNNTGNTTKPVYLTPGYDVPEDARSPFWLNELAEKFMLSDEVINDELGLEAVIGSKRNRGTAIINGTLYKIGDEVAVMVNETRFQLELKELRFDPIGVVLQFDDQEFVLLKQ